MLRKRSVAGPTDATTVGGHPEASDDPAENTRDVVAIDPRLPEFIAERTTGAAGATDDVHHTEKPSDNLPADQAPAPAPDPSVEPPSKAPVDPKQTYGQSTQPPRRYRLNITA